MGKLQPETTLVMHMEPQKLQNTLQSTKVDIHSPNVTTHNAAMLSGSSDQNPVFTIMEKQKRNNSFVGSECLILTLRERFNYLTVILYNIKHSLDHLRTALTAKPTGQGTAYTSSSSTPGDGQGSSRSCQHLASDGGYAKTKTLLWEHFGN